MSEIFATNEPVTFEVASVDNNVIGESSDYMTDTELIESLQVAEAGEESTVSSGDNDSVVELPEDLLTNETYNSGIESLVNAIDPDSVYEEVYYVDYGIPYNLGVSLPDYAVVYYCNDQEVVFPTEYAEQILISDGLLINLGSNYTAGLEIEGYDVSNYLSSEITIPTYHSSTWYQYLQSYGQPYRIVDRYVNNYGSISSSTRSSVSVEWSGGNPWAGFTFEKIALFSILAILIIMFVFRKGKL